MYRSPTDTLIAAMEDVDGAIGDAMLWIILVTIASVLLMLRGISYMWKAIQKRRDGRYCRNMFYYPRHGDED